MDILDDMGGSKLSAKVILKVNYSFKMIYTRSDLIPSGERLHLSSFAVCGRFHEWHDKLQP